MPRKKKTDNAGFVLTRENYYTPEADMAYMSCSQYDSWLECEAATVAKLQGRYKAEPTEAFLVGNYVHTYLEGEKAHAEFLDENADSIFKPKIDKKTGDVIITGKYAPFEKADRMIEALYKQPIIRHFIEAEGENEVIMHGEIFGMPWRIRLDKLLLKENTIIDYKTVADMHKTEFNPKTGQRESFVELYGYTRRGAIYTEVYKQFTGKKDVDPYFLLLCVSKQDIPDTDALMLNHRERYNFELEEVKKHLVRIRRIKNGEIKPLRCGKCDYCRSTKVIKRIRPYWELTPGFEGEKEEDEYSFRSMQA